MTALKKLYLKWYWWKKEILVLKHLRVGDEIVLVSGEHGKFILTVTNQGTKNTCLEANITGNQNKIYVNGSIMIMLAARSFPGTILKGLCIEVWGWDNEPGGFAFGPVKDIQFIW